MKKELLPDALWEIIEPILPAKSCRFQNPGRKRLDNRTVMQRILFVLKTGIPWEDFPLEMGCSGMTLNRRLREWQKSGVWKKIHETLLAKMCKNDLLNLSYAVVDSASVRAVHGGKNWAKPGRPP